MMSTHIGGGPHKGASGQEQTEREDESGCRADELRGLIERIAQQLTDAEQRQTDTLGRMLSRVEALGAEARSFKDQVPDEFLPAFERIEDGVKMLAARIATASVSDVSAPAPATAKTQPMFAADMAPARQTEATPAYEHAPRPVVDNEKPAKAVEPHAAYAIDPVMPNDDAAWDQDAADALVSHYENTLGHVAPGGYVGRTPDPESHSQRGTGVSAFLAAPPQTVVAGLKDTDRDWIESRFVEIARSVEEGLARTPSASAIGSLDDRFAQLEARFNEALSDVATRSDMQGLQLLETHIGDLVQQFDGARQQLDRLDGIEQTLAAIVDRLTDPRIDSVLDQGGRAEQDLEPLISAAVEQIASRFSQDQQQTTLSDLEGIADAAAERVATRFADLGHGSGDGDNEDVFAIRQLLDQFINERREGEEQTAAMLDTMQQAMIRVLDRVDVLEVTHAKSTPQEYVREQVRFGNEAASGAQRAADAAATFAANARQEFDDEPQAEPRQRDQESETAPRPFAVPPRAVPSAASTSNEPLSGTSSPASIERLRQDFVADARRAKAKAAIATIPTEVNQDGEMRVKPAAPRIAISEPTAAPIPIARTRPGKAESAESHSGSVTSSMRRPSRKLLVSAIVLMIAIPGVLLLLKKKAPQAPAPVAIEKNLAPEDRGIVPIKPVLQDDREVAPDVPAQGGNGRPMPTEEAPQNLESPSGSPVPPDANKDTLYRSNPQTKARDTTTGGETEDPGEIRLPRDSKAPSNPVASSGPPAGITVANPKRSPTLAQLERLSDRQAMAQLSSQLGEAQVEAVPAALIPEFMRQGQVQNPESALLPPQSTASLGQGHRQSLDLPAAAVGPLSLRLAAAKGDPSAEFEVGARFAEGKGVKQDFAEAMRWYQRSAARGFAQAQYRLATFYERGLSVKQDNNRAKVWYQRAADLGNVKAMHNLAVLSAGRTAKTPDYATAARWFQSAAGHGLADSQFNLAVLYESGLGVTRDDIQAYKWFALAARQGDAEADRRRSEMEKTMSPAYLASAKQDVDTWRPKQADRVANDPLAAGEAWKARAAAGGEI